MARKTRNGSRETINAREELYCQARSKGHSHGRALAFAGLVKNATSDTLKTDPMIEARIRTLQTQNQDIAASQPQPELTQAVTSYNPQEIRDKANEMGIDPEWVMHSLKEIVTVAIASGSPAPANTALKMLSEMIGLTGEQKAPEKEAGDDTQYLNSFKALLDTFEAPDGSENEDKPVAVPGITDDASDD